MPDTSEFRPYVDQSAADSKIRRTLSLFGKRFTYVAGNRNTGFVFEEGTQIYKVWHDG